jgi:lambda repressor-like predicted transcriptional regulator
MSTTFFGKKALTFKYFWCRILTIMKLDTQKIRDRIKEKGLTIEQAAELMGITRQGLQAILKRKTTYLGWVEKISGPLELDPKEILLPD